METALAMIMVVGFAVVGIARWYRSDTAKLRRALRTARTVSIAEALEGEVVRLDGQVVEGETVEAPLTGRRCVYYVAIAAEVGDDYRRELARETGGVTFTIDDGTGRVVVDPTDAQIDADLEDAEPPSAGGYPIAKARAFLTRRGFKIIDFDPDSLRFYEGVFEIGEQIAVMGQPVREHEQGVTAREAGYRDALPTRLRIGGSPRRPILLSDSRRVTKVKVWRP